MIISHKYKFIFIKTHKTAGTSIEVFLSQHCGPDDVLTPIHPPVEPHVARNYEGFWNPFPELVSGRFDDIGKTLRVLARRKKFYNHMPAALVKQRVPAWIWNNYYKFCLERNPWDKVLSQYYRTSRNKRDSLSLDEYLSEKRIHCADSSLYLDRSGKLLVDEVLRYESLTEDLGRVFGRLGIPFDGSLGVQAKSGYRTNKRPYQEELNSEQRKLIEKIFFREIQMHGYTF